MKKHKHKWYSIITGLDVLGRKIPKRKIKICDCGAVKQK